MPLTPDELQQRLAEIEQKVPALIQDRNTFPRAFEDETEILLGQLREADQAYALEELEKIVERSGYYR